MNRVKQTILILSRLKVKIYFLVFIYLFNSIELMAAPQVNPQRDGSYTIHSITSNYQEEDIIPPPRKNLFSAFEDMDAESQNSLLAELDIQIQKSLLVNESIDLVNLNPYSEIPENIFPTIDCSGHKCYELNRFTPFEEDKNIVSSIIVEKTEFDNNLRKKISETHPTGDIKKDIPLDPITTGFLNRINSNKKYKERIEWLTEVLSNSDLMVKTRRDVQCIITLLSQHFLNHNFWLPSILVGIVTGQMSGNLLKYKRPIYNWVDRRKINHEQKIEKLKSNIESLRGYYQQVKESVYALGDANIADIQTNPNFVSEMDAKTLKLDSINSKLKVMEKRLNHLESNTKDKILNLSSHIFKYFLMEEGFLGIIKTVIYGTGGTIANGATPLEVSNFYFEAHENVAVGLTLLAQQPWDREVTHLIRLLKSYNRFSEKQIDALEVALRMGGSFLSVFAAVLQQSNSPISWAGFFTLGAGSVFLSMWNKKIEKMFKLESSDSFRERIDNNNIKNNFEQDTSAIQPQLYKKPIMACSSIFANSY